MAEIYNPWQFSGEESVLEDGLATPAYQEQADTVEDAMEGEGSDSEMEDGEGGKAGGGHADMMAQALSTIQQQSTLISSLMAQLTHNS